MKFSNIAVLITTLSLITLLGCNKNAAIAGKYIDKNYPDDYTELKADGTFAIHQKNINSTGKYSVKDGIITLTLSSGEVFVGRLEGNIIIGNRGSRAIKQ